MKKTSSNRALSISSNAKNLLPITGEESFGFHLTQLKEGLIFDCSLSMYPSRMDGYVGQQKQFDVVTRHHFGFVFSGEVVLSRPGLPDLGLTKGMYFSSPGGFKLSGDGQASVIGREGYRGMFNVGGPVEKSGRLCYIDNCSVSQLIPPARLGDPTFQLLVFPPGVEQTEHIHPTIRLGMVVWGHGQCRLPDGTRQDLNAGRALCSWLFDGKRIDGGCCVSSR
jgi:hypothetical protein